MRSSKYEFKCPVCKRVSICKICDICDLCDGVECEYCCTIIKNKNK